MRGIGADELFPAGWGQGLEIATDVARGQAMGAQADDGQVRCAEKAVGLPKKSSRSETRSGFGPITSACERQRCAPPPGVSGAS